MIFANTDFDSPPFLSCFILISKTIQLKNEQKHKVTHKCKAYVFPAEVPPTTLKLWSVLSDRNAKTKDVKAEINFPSWILKHCKTGTK